MNHRWFAVCGVLVLCAGCAAKKHLTADQYFNEATNSFRNGALTMAIDNYHDLLDQYPFSPYGEEAELKIAEAQYLQGNYPEAVVAFTDFQRRHPTSPSLPQVGYYLGMCYVRQMVSTDRDQTAARSAEAYFDTLVQQYPDSPFAELAREQLAHCRENLADHELYIARFYAQRGNSKAAEVRLLTLAARYEETDAGADALLRLGSLYRERKDGRDAALAYEALQQSHPRGTRAETAKRALGQLEAVDPPPGTDPLDLLLAASGRHRASEVAEPVQVPGLDTEHHPAGPAGPPMPAFGPMSNPFGQAPLGFPY